MDQNVVKPEHRKSLTMAVRSTRTEYKAMQTKMYNCDKDYRKRELFHLKEEPMPIIMPAMPRFIEHKCQRCNIGNMIYTNTNDWYLEPVDVLARDPSLGFFNWNALIDQLTSFVKKDQEKEDKMVLLMKRLVVELPKFMTFLVVHPAHIRMLQNLQKTQSNIPIVYVLSTDNAIDVIALNCILMKYQLKSALIMASEEMESVVAIKKLGVYLNDIWLKKNELTKERVLDCFQYVGNIAVVLNKDNDNVLDMILKASGYGLDTEIFLITVAINHEISNTKLSRNTSDCGRVRFSFNEPYLVKELTKIKEYDDIHDDVKMTERVSQHLKFDLILRHPIMCTNVVAFLLLNQFRNGTSVDKLASAVDKFCNDNNELDYNFHGEYKDIVHYTVRLYGKDVMILEKDLIKINETIDNFEHLYGYAKVIVPHFVMDAIIVTCADYYMRLDKVVDYFKVLETAKQLSCLLNYEFLLIKPCENIESSLSSKLDTLIHIELMTKPEFVYSENEIQARKMAMYFEEYNGSDDDGDDEENCYETNKEDAIFINELKNEEWKELIELLKPILWNYSTVAECLIDLIDSIPIPEDDFIESCHQQLIKKYESETCKYGESVSKVSMKNYLKYLEQKYIIDSGYEDDDVEKKTRKIWLTNDFNEEKEIKSLISDVKRFLI